MKFACNFLSLLIIDIRARASSDDSNEFPQSEAASLQCNQRE